MSFFTMFDPLYWMLIGPTILLALYAQFRVKAAYAHWSRVGNSEGLTGAEAAAQMLRREGITDVRIEPTRGWLSDHYDPRERVLRLSPEVYSGRSVAAVGIAAHEAGHALQHAQNYAFLGLRSAMVPVVGIGSTLAWPIIFIGFLMSSLMLVKAGIVLFSGLVLFQLVTLPVEFNASSRAKLALVNNGVIGYPEEIEGVNKVLNAAALTYVAAAVSSLMTLLYFLIRAGLIGGRDD